MPYDDLAEPKAGAPKNWGDATRMLKQSAASGVDADVFADPLAPPKVKPLEYLGHMANDDVLSAGHNTGAKQIGTREAGSGSIAKQGFRKIQGNHSEPVLTKKQRAENADFEKKMGLSMVKLNIKRGMPDDPKAAGAPLRMQARAAKAAAKRPQGPLTSKSKKR